MYSMSITYQYLGVYELTDQDIKSYTLGVERLSWAIKNADFVTVSSSNLVEISQTYKPNATSFKLDNGVLLKEAQAQKLKRKPSSNVEGARVSFRIINSSARLPNI